MVCPECNGARFFAATGVIEACTWCGARGHTWHPAQIQEARRLLCVAVDDFLSSLCYASRGYCSATKHAQWSSEEACDRAAAVLGLKGSWWE